MDFTLILKFLKDLSRNNDRAWFEKNKPRYLQAKQNFDVFVAELLKTMINFDDSLAGLDPKKLSFRIYRDVRFSKDKKPYKINLGAGFSPNGKMVQEPGYYLHIEPGNKSLIAAGIYMPDAANLASIRQEIDYNAETLLKITNNKIFKNAFGKLDGDDKLKTVPKGYPKDHPHIELLKLKSFIVLKHFTDQEVLDKKFLKSITEAYKKAVPLNLFLKEAIH